MNTTIKYIIYSFLILGLFCCKTKQKVVEIEDSKPKEEVKPVTSGIGDVINSSNNNFPDNFPQSVIDKYLSLQSQDDQNKDIAPYIEFLDNGKKERLWFTTSKIDEYYWDAENSNYYFQLYYSEREVNNGLQLDEGWSEPVRFEAYCDNPAFQGYYNKFNRVQKGAASISPSMMVVACDPTEQIYLPSDRNNKNLWSLNKFEGEFINPKPLLTISSVSTWDSQPALSSNARHLFYISNRKVNADSTFSSSETDSTLHMYYSFREDKKWSYPVLVNELYSSNNVCTPHIDEFNNKLYFSCDKTGNYDIYQVPIELIDTGGYKIDTTRLSAFNPDLFHIKNYKGNRITLNNSYQQKYPFFYKNPKNNVTPQALFWSTNISTGKNSGYDINACNMPFKIELNAIIEDICSLGDTEVIQPVFNLKGQEKIEVADKQSTTFTLYAGMKYQLSGGSFCDIYACDIDSSNVFIGYSLIEPDFEACDFEHYNEIIFGSEAKSTLTEEHGQIPVYNLSSDTILYDTIRITKAWTPKKPCPKILNIPNKHRSIAYFQTGYWEVNTTANLKRDLEKLHEGFKVEITNDLYNPRTKIIRNKSDYKALSWETPLFPIKKDDKLTYSIANARWIELHPNNIYWGDRPGFGSRRSERMEGRKDRISQYQRYAKKVDENLQILTDTIKYSYFDFLNLHAKHKPKLLIEIFAVSDQREVTRGWYIGDPVEYRASYYNAEKGFTTEHIKIVPPTVDETNKRITEMKPCSIELNEDGDNGTKLGISAERSEKNTNLSRLRAWFGYKEMYNHLADSPVFQELLKENKVALPDNDVSYDDANIIITTQGRRHSDIPNPKNPYPQANNPNNKGYFDYDQIRRVEVRIQMLFPEDKRIIRTYCCDPNKEFN